MASEAYCGGLYDILKLITTVGFQVLCYITTVDISRTAAIYASDLVQISYSKKVQKLVFLDDIIPA